jgi:thiol:disulfide interchange protein
MDRIDAGAAPRDSQSRLSPVLLWVLLAALVLRIVTAVMDRPDSSAGSGLVRWQPRENAAALSRASHKPILYDFTAAWCGPCHILDGDWAQTAIAEKVNASFVPARVVDRAREDGANPADIDAMQRHFEVSGFPTLVVADADGRLIRKSEGYSGRAALIKFLEAAETAPAGAPLSLPTPPAGGKGN